VSTALRSSGALAIEDRPGAPCRDGDQYRVEVLGPLRVWTPDGREVTPDGVLQRRLLALLVLRRGHVVSVDAAVDALWGERPPRDPVAALHNHVFRLRRGLPGDLVESTGTGYRLVPSLIDLDVDRLTTVLPADNADPGIASTIDAILARWHGPAYPELDELDDGRAESIRLEELRVRAMEWRAEWRLAAGDTDGVVAELAGLADREPLRERPRALLMAALAATGRTVEALRVYDDFRRLVGDELGIEPSPALTAQHADLLAGTNAAAWTPTSRLPIPVTSLVGRDVLVGEVTATVDAHRLVTLLGPGGVGKTRLLGEVGLSLRAARPERPIVLCGLATASEESAVDVVAAALAIEGRPGVGLADRLAAVIADTDLVLLLDNCEHVLDPIAALTELLLTSCPNVRIVTTSRERLRLPAEQLCPVPTLPCSDDDAPAVRLLVDRARAVAPHFDPGPDELAVVGEIVRRLDGLPLAIELAAARLHTLDVNEVAGGLDRRFDLLSSGRRTPERHGSLYAAMSWSFSLLDARWQRIFADLSMFAGSFTVADAAAVCGLDADGAATALHQLVERSLVMRSPGRRHMLLETLRAFGAEQLAADQRVELAGERHARHFVHWIEAANQRMAASDCPGIIGEIEAALPELRTALDWLLAHGQIELAGRLVAAAFDYGLLRLRPDVLAWAARVIDADPEDRTPLAALLWAINGYAAWMTGAMADAGAHGARAERLTVQAGGHVNARVATFVGNLAMFEGRLDDAIEWYRRGREAAADRTQYLLSASTELLALGYAGEATAADRGVEVLAEVGDTRSPYAAYVWYCAGEVHLALDVERARACFDRALELAEGTSASFVTGVAGSSRASIDARGGDPLAAAEQYRRLIAHWRRAGIWSTQWTMLRSVAGLLARLERHREAAALLGAVRATHSGHRIFGADEVALTELAARLRAALGDDVFEEVHLMGAALDGNAAAELALQALAD
jgi:predicted ATPase/DNA-binding SARP family transcriptional activator